jgi:N-acyl-D-amino-acid deacylase
LLLTHPRATMCAMRDYRSFTASLREFEILKLVLCAAIAFGMLLANAQVSQADEPPTDEGRKQVLAAVERGVAVVEKAARNYPAHRKCFACHHQTLPLLAIHEAREARVRTDDTLPAEIVDFTAASFRRQIDSLRAGENIGGRGLTVGYGLMTFRLAGKKPDDLSDAMVAYLLKIQDEDGHWGVHGIRPPAEESLAMCTVVAASGLMTFAGEGKDDSAQAAIEKARGWLAAAKLDSNEDRVARLWGLVLLGGTDDERSAALAALLATQRDDGGWGQTAEMESDAYAAGSGLFVLLDSGLAPFDPAARRAVEYLLKSQLEDGSWHVTTRAKPVQVYFDNGDPHGKDQFISIAATSWATAALARSLKGADAR